MIIKLFNIEQLKWEYFLSGGEDRQKRSLPRSISIIDISKWKEMTPSNNVKFNFSTN
jgi:hypothetical protein